MHFLRRSHHERRLGLRVAQLEERVEDLTRQRDRAEAEAWRWRQLAQQQYAQIEALWLSQGRPLEGVQS
jgi:hypothetical protein